MSIFCLKQGQVLKASAAHLYPNFPWAPPPGIKMPLDYQLSTIKKFYGGPLPCRMFIVPYFSLTMVENERYTGSHTDRV